jgi:hypothetical protein
MQHIFCALHIKLKRLQEHKERHRSVGAEMLNATPADGMEQLLSVFPSGRPPHRVYRDRYLGKRSI